ncbi:hypothetical protein [Noviherbaspirillum massiliense]|uniref:hypothetical protein n=1 Tax=Noviherbaspirillum massiliense TaxID=1465823 RepID=UPI000308A816|nr:hypothetical protein [Noviherbaspirillum massiliense]
MKKTLLLSLAGTALAAPFLAHAADPNPGVHFILTGGLTDGGDTILTARYRNGYSDNIKSGGLVQLGAGVLVQMKDVPLATSFTVNYHVDDASARNGSLRFERVPLELLAFYTGVERWRFGGGVRFVQSPKATSDVDDEKETLKFKNTTGAVLEAGFGITPSAWINVRYVSEKYRPKRFTAANGVTTDVSGEPSIDGSHFGVNFLYQF